MFSTKTNFSDISRDALEGSIKYSPLILTGIAFITFITGVTLEFSSLQAQITLANEKIKSIENSNEKLLKATDVKIKANHDEKMKAVDEKINASVEKSVRIALENFLKYSYSAEFIGMRETKSDKK